MRTISIVDAAIERVLHGINACPALESCRRDVRSVGESIQLAVMSRTMIRCSNKIMQRLSTAQNGRSTASKSMLTPCRIDSIKSSPHPLPVVPSVNATSSVSLITRSILPIIKMPIYKVSKVLGLDAFLQQILTQFWIETGHPHRRHDHVWLT